MKELRQKQIVTLNSSDIQKLGLDSYYDKVLNKDCPLSDRVESLIEYLGFSCTKKGTIYLKEIIIIMYNDKNISFSDAYEIIAKRRDKKPVSVERCIRYNKEKFWKNSDDTISKIKFFIFGDLAYKNTICNSTFIYMIIQFLSTDFKILKNEETWDNYKIAAQLLVDFTKEKSSSSVCDEKREELLVFYWILSRIAKKTVSSQNTTSYYVRITIENENGNFVLKHGNIAKYVSCLVNKEEFLNVVKNVLTIFDGLKEYWIRENSGLLTEFTVYMQPSFNR